MIGSETMTLYGWRVLAEWSLEHSCIDSKQKSGIKAEWENRWNDSCQWIIDMYAEKY
jgi:adenosine deaminase CECR1